MVALLAVILGSNLFGAESALADATIVCGTTNTNPPTGSTTVSTNTIVYCQATTPAAVTTVNWTVTATGNASVGTTANDTNTATAGTTPTANFSFTALQPGNGTGGSFTVKLDYTDGNGTHPNTQPGQQATITLNTASGVVTSGSAVPGGSEVITFSLPANIQCTSDTSAITGAARTCTAADVSLTGAAATNAVVNSVTPAGNDNAAGTVTVNITKGSTTGTLNVNLSVFNAATGTAALNSFLVTVTETVAPPVLRHMGGANNTEVLPVQDIFNNVRGSRHVVCVTDSTGTNGVVVPITQANQIQVINSGGYLTMGDQTPTFSDPQFFTQTVGASTATCFSWVSTGAGDQQIVATYPLPGGGVQTVDFTAPGGASNVNDSLIKEWNVLESSIVTGPAGTVVTNGVTPGAATASTVNYALTRQLTLDPVGGLHLFQGVALSDVFTGSHVTAAGGTAVAGGGSTAGIALAGVNWTVSLDTGSCGILSGTLSGTTYNTVLNGVVTVAGLPNVTLLPGNSPATDCAVGRTATVIFTGNEPGPIGSGPGKSVTETVVVSFTQPIPIKQVLLAWAGQRVVLEHDWRLPVGESAVDSTAANGFCAFPNFADVTYVRGGGPGNFVNSLVGAQGTLGVINGGDQLTVRVGSVPNGQNDPRQAAAAPNGPNNSCISRVVYESEDQGEVDVEAWVNNFGGGPFVTLATLPRDYDAQSQVFAVTSLPTDVTIGTNLFFGDNTTEQVKVLSINLAAGTITVQRGANGTTAVAHLSGTNLLRYNPVTTPGGPVFGNASKVAFVVYYMKLNQVQLSLVTQVAKPTHNVSASGSLYYVGDYAPGNPWDASKDATGGSADWNVSKDILVRGRVTGWFTNSNPSGRARDESNKQNVLPADRWVMPDDWANIAGGSALASAFRPSYDLMFAPNSVAGFALGHPTGTTNNQVLPGNQIAAVAATSTGKGNGFGVPTTNLPIVVTTKAFMTTNQVVFIGTTLAQICAISPTSNSITVRPILQQGNAGACQAYPLTSPGLAAAPAAGTPIYAALPATPFIGPYSLVDQPGFAILPGSYGSAFENDGNGVVTAALWRDTTQGDGVVDWWDAPMPPAEMAVTISGTGFLKQVLKEQVYYTGNPVSAAVALGGTQAYPNPYYYQNIPASPYLPAVVSGGGYTWDSWGGDGPFTFNCATSSFVTCAGGQGPYHFWQPAALIADATLSTVNKTELTAIQGAYSDPTISRGMVMYSDNHGEFMVTANGDFKTDLTACAANVLAGGKQCKPGDKVGTGTISAVADYPDFVKHFPVAAAPVTVNWTWGGYKDVTIEPGETDQYSYVVFHAMDRDGHCTNTADGAVLLHPVDTVLDSKALGQGTASNGVYSHYPTPNQLETVDFLIDSGSGIILANSGLPFGMSSPITGTSVTPSGERGNLIGLPTYSVLDETLNGTGKKTFPLSPLAASGQTDECQAWIKVSNSLLGVTNVLAIAHDDEGNIGFDKVIDFQSTMSYTLNFRWSLITWNGADNIPVADALKGGASTKNPAGNDISASVTAVYGWDQAAQQWLAFFPTGVNVPGANNLTALKDGSAYWIAITGPGSVTWTVSTNVS